jgi:hypothetical protein
MATKHFKEKAQKTVETKQVEEKNVLVDNPKFEKDIRDGKTHKDTKDTKDHKEGKDVKDTKEHNKREHKEHIETAQPLPFADAAAGVASPGYSVGQNPIQPKPYKELLKEFTKEILDHKHIKEYTKEVTKELHKEIYEYKLFEVPNDPGGPIEQRMQALEATVSQLSHFIPAALRPDLSQGALKQESDVAAKAKKAAPKKAAKKSAKSAS